MLDEVFERSSNGSEEKWEESEGGDVREGEGSVGGGVLMNPDVYAIIYLKTKAIHPPDLFIRESGFWLSAMHTAVRPSSLCKASHKAAVCWQNLQRHTG